MQYKVEYTQRAVKQLKKLDKHTRKLILSWIEKKFSWLHKSKSSWKGLTANKSGQWRIGWRLRIIVKYKMTS